MKQIYRIAALFFLGTLSIQSVIAQTHYGVGAGTQGGSHAFFGTNAGKVNAGNNNTFIGHEAGKENTTGGENTFIGFNAGLHNIKSGGNTFVGKSAGENTKSGSANTFIGEFAGGGNGSGDWNTYIGRYAGLANSAGSHNVAVGNEAGEGAHGHKNIMIGNLAGEYVDGNENIMIGSRTGRMTKTSYNTFIGFNAGFTNTAGAANALYGTEAGYSNTIGSNNAFFGYGSGYSNTKGEKNTYLGYAAGGNPELINATAIGALSKVTASNSLVLGNNAKVGIGMSAPAYQLHLSTDEAAKLGTPVWTVASDKRLKKDISDYTDGLEMLKKIHPVWFRYNGEAGTKTDKKFVGVIAQEMKEVAPYTVGSFTYQDTLGNKTEYLDYDAGAVTYMLVNAVKEQQEIIDQKEAKIQDLAKRLEILERIVASGTIKPLTGNSAARQEPSSDGVTLEQNAPNGFSQGTVIRFFIPQSVKEAVINIYTVAGVKVGSYPVAERGDSSLTLSAEEFENGVFVYDLVTDGKSNGARKMMVAK
ncbi:tail fiber domain-containing protein [Dyadobacter chenwenxiniae]|uniref:Tail fiber domain-containing protein n=1 Tax=Dyadobacter chenwenxiniae TaxID=2906456 RepID=A0A9X1PIZ3_9BACT|nr:tail fiber domain-containing protein [Dyadobacter chenwenxiniae]MCF0060839.1 tail fiber domain-containing protein [Dyadobacter chenwenxiniae]UON80668.1 tail fiber domain-containing protein [Dyadobacter chenwenxiniae]